MLLQIKVYLIAVVYCLGALFMVLFPPRNYEQSGAKVRAVRGARGGVVFKRYLDQGGLLAAAARLARGAPRAMRVRHLQPPTAQNRSLVALELRSDWQTRKPGVLVVGALDAMAWGAPNAVMELAERLLFDANYQSPFFNDYDWYLVPAANPDGIHFTRSVRSRPALDAALWSTNASARARARPSAWHKNLEKDTEEDACFGTNINRNFAYHWRDGAHGAADRCSQWHAGARPFCAAEARALRAYVDGLAHLVQLAVHVHASFTPRKEFILYPWRYSLRRASNHRTLQEIGEYAARRARAPDGRVYEVHQGSADGRVAGSLADYLAGVAGVELVFTVKPFHQVYPDDADPGVLATYVERAARTVLGVVRGWRSSTRLNTLSFFGADVEF